LFLFFKNRWKLLGIWSMKFNNFYIFIILNPPFMFMFIFILLFLFILFLKRQPNQLRIVSVSFLMDQSTQLFQSKK